VANNFIHQVSKGVGAAITKIGNYDLPSATQGVIIGVSVSNTSAVNITASVYLFVASLNTTVSIITNAPIFAGQTLVAVGADQKVVMQPGDSIQVQGSAAGACDVIASILTIS